MNHVSSSNILQLDYENYIEAKYPNWKEKVVIRQRKELVKMRHLPSFTNLRRPKRKLISNEWQQRLALRHWK